VSANETILVVKKDQVHLILLGLRTAAVVSRQNGHTQQANDFSDVAEAIEKQRDDHETE